QWGIDMLEVSAAVLAAIDAVIGAGVNHERIIRMHGEAEDRSPALVSLPQFSSGPTHTSIGTAPETHAQSANADGEIFCHGRLLQWGMEYWTIGMMESWIQYSSVPRFH